MSGEGEQGIELPEGVLCVRQGPGGNCSSAGSAIDILFYSSLLLGAISVALAAAFPPAPPPPPSSPSPPPPDDTDKEGERKPDAA